MVRSFRTPLFRQPSLLVVTAGLLSTSLFAQQLDREIAFVRSLAKDMRLIELARIEADILAKNNVSGGDTEKVAQLAVEIAYYGARSRSDRVQQRTLFKDAVQKSKELIEASTNDQVKLEARATLANASQDFGQFLTEELDIAREQTPDKVKEIEEEAAQVFRAGIEACGKVMEVLKSSKEESKKTEYYLMWMKKAVLTREQGRADKANRSVLVGRAIEELSEMVLEVGEETAIGLRGLFEIAQCHEVEGKVADAIDSYKGTIKQIATSLEQAQKGELDLPGELQGFLFDMLQEVYVRTGETMLREGAQGTADLFAEFRKHMAAFGEKNTDLFDVVSDTHGHLMLLAEARFHAESGDPKKVGEALATAQKINDKHPQDYVGVRAKAALRDILQLQRNLVSGSLLFEIAKGEMQNKNYEEAIKRLRIAIPAMTPEEQKKLGLQAYEMMGLAFAYTDRYLEAMLACREGLQKFGEEDKDRAASIADAADRAMSQHKRQTKNDPTYAVFYKELAEQLASSNVVAGDKLFLKDGNAFFNEKKYAEAIATYSKVTPDSVQYEGVLVNIAKAQAATGNHTDARATRAKFRAHIAKTNLAASDTGKQQIRATAVVDAEFAELGMAYTEARGNDDLKIKKDLTKYPVALEKAQNFVTNFAKDGERNIPTALEYIGRLNADLGKLDLAEAAYKELQPKDATRAARLATELFNEYRNQVKALNDDLTKMIAANKPEGEIKKAEAEIANVRTKLVTIGMDYINNSAKPQLGILVNTMLTWEQLGDWKRVDEVAKKTLSFYETDNAEATKKVVDQIVRPKVGEALLQQRQFTDAYAMLVAAEKANPTQWELKRQIARALGGWFEFDRGTGKPQAVIGLEKYAEAYQKYYGDPKESYRVWIEGSKVPKFSLEWYEFTWQAYWFARQAGQKDGKFKEIADKLFRQARSTDDFASLKNHGAEGLLLYRYFQANR